MECDLLFLLSSPVFGEASSVFSYKRSIKYLSDIRHPVLDKLASELEMTEEQKADFITLLSGFNGELLEPYNLFRNNKKHDDLEVFKGESLIAALDKIVSDSRHGTIVTHPAKMSHPSVKFPRIYATNIPREPDGLVRTGNTESHFDLHINATQLKVFKFLSLCYDGRKLIDIVRAQDVHVFAKAFSVSESQASGWVEKLQYCLYSQVNKTHALVKQVYFPVGDEYHQLSLLTPSGQVFALKDRINHITNTSGEAYVGKNARRGNAYADVEYSTLPDLTVTKHGGDHPKNISGLNNKYQTYYLLSSSPPPLTPRNIRLPKEDFFVEVLNPWHIKETFDAFHRIVLTDYNNINIREGRDYRIQEYIDYVIQKMWQLRSFIDEYECELSGTLKAYQKIWLYPDHKEQRESDDEWLDDVCSDLIRSFTKQGYQKVLGRKAATLGDNVYIAVEKIVKENREALR